MNIRPATPSTTIRNDDGIPRVGIPICVKTIDGTPFYAIGQRYLDALVALAVCIPVPILPSPLNEDAASLVNVLDGLMLTGSVSNIAPEHYRQSMSTPSLPTDTARDALSLPLVRAALAANLPVLGICRGMQEINVALGGTLYQAVHEVPTRLDHRRPADRSGSADANAEVDLNVQYAPVHAVRFREGGKLSNLFSTSVAMVNSLHGQALDQLAAGIEVEAYAEDGTIEAICRPDKHFFMAVQWHPEWQADSNPLSRALFGAFGDACRSRMRERGGLGKVRVVA